MIRVYKTKLYNLCACFLNDRNGNVAIIAGASMVVMILIAGSGLDFGRAYNVRTALERALDSATLAGARQLSTSMATKEQVTATVSDFFKANMETAGYRDVTVSDVTVSINQSAGTIDVSASAKVPTTFIGISGLNTITVGAVSESTFSHYDVELAMVVDVTGSMGGDMDALRSAAQSLVDILIPAGTTSTESKVRISLVPYSQGVNLGTYAAAVSNGEASRNCITEREGEQKFTDATYNYAGEDSEFFGGGSSSCSQHSKLLPLSGSRSALTTAISGLSASGATAGQTGIAWGWYTLAPSWSNLWPSDSAPGPYDDDEILKFAILMTDGGFNAYYDKESKPCAWWAGSACNGQKEWFHKGANKNDHYNEAFVRARELCDGIKDSKIKVYSIFFNTGDSSAAAQKTMKYCASSSESYYLADNASDLIAAFQKIANQIQSIYLSK